MSNQDGANNNYVDKNAITTDGGVVYRNIKLGFGSDMVRSLECNDLTAGKKITVLLGSDTNILTYSIPNTGLPVPLKIKTDVGLAILINELPICVFGQDEIFCSRLINNDQNSIKKVMSPANKFDAVNKAYTDRIKYKTATGNITDIVTTDHTLFAFPAVKAFLSGKIKICEMWVERLADEWIASSSPMFATAWPGFHKFSEGPSLMTFFTGFPPVGGLAIFASTILNYRDQLSLLRTCCNIELYIYIYIFIRHEDRKKTNKHEQLSITNRIQCTIMHKQKQNYVRHFDLNTSRIRYFSELT